MDTILRDLAEKYVSHQYASLLQNNVYPGMTCHFPPPRVERDHPGPISYPEGQEWFPRVGVVQPSVCCVTLGRHIDSETKGLHFYVRISHRVPGTERSPFDVPDSLVGDLRRSKRRNCDGTNPRQKKKSDGTDPRQLMSRTTRLQEDRESLRYPRVFGESCVQGEVDDPQTRTLLGRTKKGQGYVHHRRS